MLKTWIEQIKNQPDRYGTVYWKYHLSSNMLELSVKKEFVQQESEYRNAVISIGKVLQALRQKLTGEGLQHHIQSFPNLDDSALIAAIRIFNSAKSKSKKSVNTQKGDEPAFMLEALENCAAANQLNLHHIHPTELPDVVIPSPDKKFSWFALCADHDNPFTWLRVGYWKEYLQNLEDKNKTGLIIVSDSVICNNRLILNGSVNNKYVQLLIGIPEHSIADN